MYLHCGVLQELVSRENAFICEMLARWQWSVNWLRSNGCIWVPQSCVRLTICKTLMIHCHREVLLIGTFLRMDHNIELILIQLKGFRSWCLHSEFLVLQCERRGNASSSENLKPNDIGSLEKTLGSLSEWKKFPNFTWWKTWHPVFSISWKTDWALRIGK